jgi:hypothetical protein
LTATKKMHSMLRHAAVHDAKERLLLRHAAAVKAK